MARLSIVSRALLRRLVSFLFPLLLIAALGYLDAANFGRKWWTLGVGLGLAVIILLWPEISSLLRELPPRSPHIRNWLGRIAIAALLATYFLLRGRGPLPLGHAVTAAVPVVVLVLILASLGRFLDRPLGVFYRLRNRLLQPWLRGVATIALSLWLLFRLRSNREALVPEFLPAQPDVARAALASLAVTVIGYLLLHRPRPQPERRPTSKRRRLVLAAIGAVLFLLIAGGIAYPWIRPVSPPDHLAEQAKKLGSIASIEAFVGNKVGEEPYQGVLRGPVGTLWAMAGNQEDRTLLLDALLERAGKKTAKRRPASGAQHTLEIRFITHAARGATEEKIRFHTADLSGRDIRIFYETKKDRTFAVVEGPGGRLESKADAASATMQELVFRITGPGMEPTERRRELFTAEFPEHDRFDPSNRYTIVVTTGWVPESVRIREDGYARKLRNKQDGLARRIAYTFLSFSDENAQRLAREQSVSARILSPRITIVSDEAVGGTDGRSRSLSLDLRKNELALEGDPSQRLAYATVRSLYDASLESTVVRTVTGEPATSAADVLAEAFGGSRTSSAARQEDLRSSLEKLLQRLGGEHVGAAITLSPVGRPEYSIHFEKREEGLEVTPSERVRRAVDSLPPDRREDISSIFGPLIGERLQNLEGIARRADAAVMGAAGLAPNYAAQISYSPPYGGKWYVNSRIFQLGEQYKGKLLHPDKVTGATRIIRTAPNLESSGQHFYNAESDTFSVDLSGETFRGIRLIAGEAEGLNLEADLERSRVVTDITHYSFGSITNVEGRIVGMFSRAVYRELKEDSAVIRNRDSHLKLSDPIRLWIVERRSYRISVNGAPLEIPVLIVGGDFEKNKSDKPERYDDIPVRLNADGATITRYEVLDDPDFPFYWINERIRVQAPLPGRIVDAETGLGISDSTVLVRNPETDNDWSAETWPDGRFLLPLVTNAYGPFEVTIEAKGYEPLTLTRDFTKPEALQLDFSLKPARRGEPAQEQVLTEFLGTDVAIFRWSDISDIEGVSFENLVSDVELNWASQQRGFRGQGSRTWRLVRQAIESDHDVVVLVPLKPPQGPYGPVDAWLEVNTRTGESYPRLEDGLYGGSTVPSPPGHLSPIEKLGWQNECTLWLITAKIDLLAAEIDATSVTGRPGPRQGVVASPEGGSPQATFKTVSTLARGLEGLRTSRETEIGLAAEGVLQHPFGDETYLKVVKDMPSTVSVLQERTPTHPFEVKPRLKPAGLSPNSAYSQCYTAPPWIIVVIIVVVIPGKDEEEEEDEEGECRCEVGDWQLSGLVLNFVQPRGTLRSNLGDPVPLVVDGEHVHELSLTHWCERKNKPSQPCTETFRQKERVGYEWEILPGSEGGFARINDDTLRPEDVGPQVLFLPPDLNVGEEKVATLRVRGKCRDGHGSKEEVKLTCRRVSSHAVEIRVEGAQETKAPKLDPVRERGTGCECQPTFRYMLHGGSMVPRTTLGDPMDRVPTWERDARIAIPKTFVAVEDRVRLGIEELSATGDTLQIRSGSGNCKPTEHERLVEPFFECRWEVTGDNRGSFPAGNMGETVVYQAPATPGAAPIRLTITDLRTGWKATREIQLDILELGIDLVKVDPAWLPDPRNGRNRVSPLARICRREGGKWVTPGRRRQILFTLSPSTEPGICMNYPLNGNTRPDLFFDETDDRGDFVLEGDPAPVAGEATCPADILIVGDNPAHAHHYQVATSQSPVAEARVVIRCEDFGAFGFLLATARGCTDLEPRDTEVSPAVEQRRPGVTGKIKIPRDDNGNDIADSAPQDADGALPTTDNDQNPRSDFPGDGLTNYEEYRGFIVGGVVGTASRQHIRTNVDEKDLFIHDSGYLAIPPLPIGYGHLSQTRLSVWTLEHADLYNTNAVRVINFNQTTHSRGLQHGLHLVVGALGGPRGRANPSAGAAVPLRPAITLNVTIDITAINNETPGGAVPGMHDRVRAHEIGHAVGIRHHGQGTTHSCGGTVQTELFGLQTSGDHNCVVRYTRTASGWCHDAHHRHALPVTPAGLPDDHVGNTYCDNSDGTGVHINYPQEGHRNNATVGNCRSQIRVKDW